MTHDHNQDCISVNQSATVEQCVNENAAPVLTPPGRRIIKVPVTLAEVSVRTNLVSNIRFPDPVLEIKDIKKRVKLVQCRLLLGGVPAGTNPFTPGAQQLHLRGFVRKNIQYATPSPAFTSSCVASDLRSLTVDIPFECVTTILAGQFITPPQLPILNTRNEFDFFRAQDLGQGFPEKDQLLSSDLSQFHQVSTQFFNELPFCELISSRITEWDEAVDRQPLHNHAPFEEGTFQNIVEKMFLEFTVKVLQNQQVAVTAIT